MEHGPLASIAILGGGTAGWMTAAALARHYRGAGIAITLIESSAIGTVGVGEATIPTLRPFYQSLGLSDAEVICATQATCKLGIAYHDWKAPGSSFIHPFGGFGHDYGGVGFQHYFNRWRREFGLGPLDAYAMGSALARAGRFALPAPPPNAELYNHFDWALHFDAALFAKLMRGVAEAAGVRRVDATLQGVRLRPEDGFIDALDLDTGESVRADLFIDCSGFNALLIGKALGVGYEDYSDWLFCDRAVAVQSARAAAPRPLTEVSAQKAGWRWHIPLQHRSGNGHVFSSAHMSDDEAVATLMAQLPGAAAGEPRVIRFRPGRREQAWAKNCIAIGLASGFLEPLESTSIALIQTGIERVRQLLPATTGDWRALRDEHNDMARREMERTRDFLILHYKLNRRGDTDFWRQAAAMDVPDTLARKTALYRQRGHFVRYRWEMFHPVSWLAIYAGFDVWPETVDPAAANIPEAQMRDIFTRLRAQIAASVERAQPHAAFLDYCRRIAEKQHVPA